MSKKIYTQKQIDELNKNPYIKSCNEIYLEFTTKAKYKAVRLWESWLICKDVFRKMKLPEYIINSAIPTRNINAWKRTIKEKWESVFYTNKRWRKKGYGKVNPKNMTTEEYIKFLETENSYLKEENRILLRVKKKILTKGEKFSIIWKLYPKHNLYNLCLLAWVSVSWFYAYKYRVQNNRTMEDKDKNDYEAIRKLAMKRKGKKWYRSITMSLYTDFWIIMNHKKVYRIMKTYNLLSIIRQRNPYKNIMKATLEHRVVKNVLNREFKWLEPFKKLWTDISYIKYKWNHVYLSIVKDIVSWEILSSYLWTGLWIDIVAHTIDILDDYKKKQNIDFNWSIIHSDQWYHYTHPNYSSRIKDMWFIQSMSRRWNCIDNAPTESFFWHMKDELDVSGCKNIKELKDYVNNYIIYYNNFRPQWTRKKMTPVAYRNHLLSQNN